MSAIFKLLFSFVWVVSNLINSFMYLWFFSITFMVFSFPLCTYSVTCMCIESAKKLTSHFENNSMSVSRNEGSRIVLLFLKIWCVHASANTQVTWKFSRYGDGDNKTSVSGAWMICPEITSLEPSALMQMHCSSKAIYNFESPMIKMCLSHRDTINGISSALLFPFERKTLHYLIWDEPTSVELQFTGRTISSSIILYFILSFRSTHQIRYLYTLIQSFFLLQILIDHLRTCCKCDQYTWTFKLRPFHQIRKQRV